jgi:hypothetical protein
VKNLGSIGINLINEVIGTKDTKNNRTTICEDNLTLLNIGTIKGISTNKAIYEIIVL